MRKISAKEIRLRQLKGEKITTEDGKPITLVKPKKQPKQPTEREKFVQAIETMAQEMVTAAKRSDASMDMVTQIVGQTLAVLKDMNAPQRKKTWNFKVHRDGNKMIKAITAKEV